MCSPVNQLGIKPKKIKSFSEMQECCEECPLNFKSVEKTDEAGDE